MRGVSCKDWFSSNKTSGTLLNKWYTLRWPIHRPVADSLTGIVRKCKMNTIFGLILVLSKDKLATIKDKGTSKKYIY